MGNQAWASRPESGRHKVARIVVARLAESQSESVGAGTNITRSIKEATFISYFLQHLREQKLDLGQIAECFCVDSGIQVSSQTPAHSKKTFRVKELAQFVVKQLQPYQTAELADAQDRIKELEGQLAQQQKRTHSEAEIGPEPISNSQSSQASQSDGTARLPFKSSPSQARPSKGKSKSKPSSKGSFPQKDPSTLTEKAFDPAFTPSKVLGSNAPPTALPQAITKWISKLRSIEELKAQLQQSCKVAAAIWKSCTEEEIDILHQRAADFGLPARHLQEAKESEILKIVLAASALAS